MLSVPTLCFVVDHCNLLTPLVENAYLNFINVVAVNKQYIVLSVAVGRENVWNKYIFI